MISSLIREHHWTPDYINGLYLDDIDHFGIMWIYNDIKEYIKELDTK